MKCSRAVALFATGGPLGRWLARRHGVHCPGCAAEFARVRWIARELSDLEPLSPASRAVWASLSAEPSPREARPPRFRRTRLAGIAAAGVVAIVIAERLRRAIEPAGDLNLCSTPIITVPEHPWGPAEAKPRLDGLTADLQALSRDLAFLRKTAALLDERKEIAALAHRLEQPLAFNAR